MTASRAAGPTIAIDGAVTWNYLPHRFPFMLLDRVEAFDPAARRLVGVKGVSQNEPFLQGHFPEHPIFPGVVIIEALAQASGMLFNLEFAMEHGATLEDLAIGRTGVALPRNVILAESRIKHTKPVYPGSQMLLDTQTVLARGDLSSFKVTATVDGEEVSKGQLTLARLSSMPTMEFKA